MRSNHADRVLESVQSGEDAAYSPVRHPGCVVLHRHKLDPGLHRTGAERDNLRLGQQMDIHGRLCGLRALALKTFCG